MDAVVAGLKNQGAISRHKVRTSQSTIVDFNSLEVKAGTWTKHGRLAETHYMHIALKEPSSVNETVDAINCLHVKSWKLCVETLHAHIESILVNVPRKGLGKWKQPCKITARVWCKIQVGGPKCHGCCCCRPKEPGSDFEAQSENNSIYNRWFQFTRSQGWHMNQTWKVSWDSLHAYCLEGTVKCEWNCRCNQLFAREKLETMCWNIARSHWEHFG